MEFEHVDPLHVCRGCPFGFWDSAVGEAVTMGNACHFGSSHTPGSIRIHFLFPPLPRLIVGGGEAAPLPFEVMP